MLHERRLHKIKQIYKLSLSVFEKKFIPFSIVFQTPFDRGACVVCVRYVDSEVVMFAQLVHID